MVADCPGGDGGVGCTIIAGREEGCCESGAGESKEADG